MWRGKSPTGTRSGDSWSFKTCWSTKFDLSWTIKYGSSPHSFGPTSCGSLTNKPYQIWNIRIATGVRLLMWVNSHAPVTSPWQCYSCKPTTYVKHLNISTVFTHDLDMRGLCRQAWGGDYYSRNRNELSDMFGLHKCFECVRFNTRKHVATRLITLILTSSARIVVRPDCGHFNVIWKSLSSLRVSSAVVPRSNLVSSESFLRITRSATLRTADSNWKPKVLTSSQNK
jgi:hypothetical protein